MSQERDLLDLAKAETTVSTVTTVNSTMDPDLWEDIGLPYDYHPAFGWNVPEARYSNMVGLGIAIQCASVKARDIAKAGLTLWKRERMGQRRRWVEVEPNEHPFARLLARKPNSVHTWGDFWRMVILHLELAQNAYVLKNINRRGEVTELLPLQSARVRPRISTQGNLFYEILANTEFERSQLRADTLVVPADRIIHFRGKMLDGLSGLSNLVLGNPIFELIGAISNFQTALFGNDGQQPMVFETEQQFTGDMADTAFRRLKQQLTERTRKMARTGDPILLEAGMKAKLVGSTAKDAMPQEAYRQMVERICGLMQVPPHKIHHYGDGAKYDNQAAADNQYAADSLIPTADIIEERLVYEVLPEEEWGLYWPEFDRERMTSSDARAMNERVKVAMTTGVMMINEARERLGMNPVDGGDRFLIPTNMAMMEEDGTVVVQAAEGQNENPGAEPPAEDDDEEPAEERSIRLVHGK